VDGESLGVIDFDDCGFSWFFCDFAATVSFMEHEPVVDQLQHARLEGYRTVAPVSREDEAMLPAFVMLRRMLLTAWLASHSDTETARRLRAGYTGRTIAMGDAIPANVVTRAFERSGGRPAEASCREIRASHLSHQFRTRNDIDKAHQTRSESSENAVKSTKLIDILPLITVWLQVQVLSELTTKSIAVQSPVCGRGGLSPQVSAKVPSWSERAAPHRP
jgi:hypothetical protein